LIIADHVADAIGRQIHISTKLPKSVAMTAVKMKMSQRDPSQRDLTVEPMNMSTMLTT